jgi:hypothetical protein
MTGRRISAILCLTPAMLPCYSATLLLSAFLLFLVQPMSARGLLPLLGGTPAVWTTSLLFFQAVLLLGSLYAHAVARLAPRLQAAVHLLVFAGVLFWSRDLVLLRADGAPAELEILRGGSPVLFVLRALAAGIGPPFFVLSATAPLLLRWVSLTGHRRAGDPYFLYGASNAGSFLALIAYPLLVEPNLDLARQGRLFSGGCLLLFLLIAGCAAFLRAGAAAAGAPQQPLPEAAISWRTRLRWLALSFVPCSLMMGVTAYLSTDIAAVPLLWVIPLGLYLLSFILAFLPLPGPLHDLFARVMPLLVLALLFLGLLDGGKTWVLLPLHLFVFFLVALVCHGELRRARPAPARLTEFYLILATGGVLAGVVNAVLAPRLFPIALEYPLVLAASCALLPLPAAGPGSERRALIWSRLWPLLCAAGILALAGGLLVHQGSRIWAGLTLVLCYALLLRTWAYAPTLVVLVGLFQLAAQGLGSGRVLHRERSFFGVMRVEDTADGRVRQLLHGTTLHGKQAVGDPARRREPLSYYVKDGPVGWIHAAAPDQGPDGKPRRVAVIGLGAGALCSYARSGETYVFYEIDPAVVRIARDPRYFTFLSDCEAGWQIHIGDARLRLREAPPGAYDLLIVDAFSSDAVPVHLLTRQALDLYVSRLSERGLLVFHTSNRYFRLEPLFAALAADAGLPGVHLSDPGDFAADRYPSTWVVLARRAEDLAGLHGRPQARDLVPRPGVRAWTDGFADPLSLLRWRIP